MPEGVKVVKTLRVPEADPLRRYVRVVGDGTPENTRLLDYDGEPIPELVLQIDVRLTAASVATGRFVYLENPGHPPEEGDRIDIFDAVVLFEPEADRYRRLYEDAERARVAAEDRVQELTRDIESAKVLEIEIGSPPPPDPAPVDLLFTGCGPDAVFIEAEVDGVATRVGNWVKRGEYDVLRIPRVAMQVDVSPQAARDIEILQKENTDLAGRLNAAIDDLEAAHRELDRKDTAITGALACLQSVDGLKTPGAPAPLPGPTLEELRDSKDPMGTYLDRVLQERHARSVRRMIDELYPDEDSLPGQRDPVLAELARIVGKPENAGLSFEELRAKVFQDLGFEQEIRSPLLSGESDGTGVKPPSDELFTSVKR